MRDPTPIKIGSIGTLVAGVCCITPAPALPPGALGPSIYAMCGLIRDRSE